MIQVFYGLVLLVLVVAIVVLYAMFGELASRMPATEEPDLTVWPFDRARIGAVPARWPDAIGEFISRRDGEFAELLVLSSSCTSCNTVADQLVAEKRADPDLGPDVFTVVSCPTRERGEQFIERHELRSVAHYLDVEGEWVTGNFDVTLSPCALLFKDGALSSALAFQDLGALHEAVPAYTTGKENPWKSPSGHGPEAELSRGEASSA